MTFSNNPQPSDCGFGIADFGLKKSQLRFFHNPQSEISNPQFAARRAKHVSASDGGGVVWAHFDPSLDLLDAMPLLRGESRQRRVVTPVSRPLRLYPDENV